MHPQGAKQRGNDPLLCVSGDFKNVACFDPKTLHLKHEIPTPKGFNSRVISIPPEGGREEELVAVGEADSHDYLSSYGVFLHSPHEVDSPFRRLSTSLSSPIRGLAYVVSPSLVVAGSSERMPELVVSNVDSGEKVMNLQDPPKCTMRITRGAPGRGNSFVFVGGGRFVLGAAGSIIRHYDLGRSERANQVVMRFKGHTDWACGLGYSTEKNHLFSSSCDRTLRIWSVQDGTCLHTLQLSDESLSLLFDPKKRLVFCGVKGGIIEVWDYRQTKERVRQFNHPTGKDRVGIWDVTQIGDGMYASIGDEDFSVATWTDSGKILATAKTSGQNNGLCLVGSSGRSSDALRSDDDDRLAFVLETCYVLPTESVRVTGFLAGKALLCLSGL